LFPVSCGFVKFSFFFPWGDPGRLPPFFLKIGVCWLFSGFLNGMCFVHRALFFLPGLCCPPLAVPLVLDGQKIYNPNTPPPQNNPIVLVLFTDPLSGFLFQLCSKIRSLCWCQGVVPPATLFSALKTTPSLGEQLVPNTMGPPNLFPSPVKGTVVLLPLVFWLREHRGCVWKVFLCLKKRPPSEWLGAALLCVEPSYPVSRPKFMFFFPPPKNPISKFF